MGNSNVTTVTTAHLPIEIRKHDQTVQESGERLQSSSHSKPFLQTSQKEIHFKCNKCKFQTSEPMKIPDHMTNDY